MRSVEVKQRAILDALRSGSWWTTKALEGESGSNEVAKMIEAIRISGTIIDARCVSRDEYGNPIMEYRMAPAWAQRHPLDNRDKDSSLYEQPEQSMFTAEGSD
jgi:hypothetical protein